MMQKKIALILVLVSLIGCSNNTYVAPSISKVQANENAKKYPALQGVHVWLQVKNHAIRKKYCDVLTSKGMIVDCEKYKTITSMVGHNEIAVTCPQIKKEVTSLIIDLLKMPNTKKVDVSGKPGYSKGESCTNYNALFVELFESTL